MFHKSIKYLFPVYMGAISLANAQEVIPTTTAKDSTAAQITPITQDSISSISEENEVRKYVLGDIVISGNVSYNEMTILTFTGLQKGQEISIPGEELSDAIRKLWKLGTFSDVNFYEKSIVGNVINLELYLNELPRINTVTVKGLKKGKREELLKELKMDEKSSKKIINENLLTTTKNYIANKYKKDGYFKTKVDIEVKPTGDKKTRDLVISFDKGKKVRISKINFEGNTQFTDAKLRKAMKNTKQKSPLNPLRIFKPSKYIEEKYSEDLVNVIDKYKEKGYRDARILKDTAIYNPKNNTMKVDITLEEGKKYYIGDIRFLGNTAFTDSQLRRILGFKKGDVYNGVLLQKRTQDFTNPDAFDLTNAYQNDGYLWSRVTPIERVENDTINLDFRIMEGPKARYNYITVSGNDKTHDYVVLREVYTRPGQLWKKADVVESHRRLASMGIFDAQSLNPNIKNADPAEGTVDVEWQVVESGQSQVEVQGGYGGRTFIGTLALSFNNFSVKNLFNKNAYRPFPMGDAQKMSLRLQASTYFQTYSLSFQEPWFGGKKPTQLFGSISHSRQNYYDYYSNNIDRSQGLSITTVSLGLAKRLSVPDDKFVLSHSISYQQYKLNNYNLGNFAFNNGTARNLSYTIDLTRDNVGGIDPFIYPSTGSRFSITGKFSPPYSLFNKINYKDLENQEAYKVKTTSIQPNPQTGADIPIGTYLDENGMPVADYRDAAVDRQKLDQKRFNWLEYYKINFKADWYTEIAPKLVLRTSGQFGFLGAYNQDRGTIPFERFYLGGSGMMNYSLDGRENIALRGYADNSLTPGYTENSSLSTQLGGTVYNKFSMELRYPISLQAQMKAYVLTFVDAGATYSSFKDYNPFRLQRSAGAGVRVSMPMFGMLGIDFGYGFDNIPGTNQKGGWQTHFILGQQF